MPGLFIPSLSSEQYHAVVRLYLSMDTVAIEQYPGFAKANTDNEVCHYIQTDSDGSVTAYAQIDVRKLRIASIPFGPLAVNADSFRSALLDIKGYCQRQLIPMLRVTPPFDLSKYGEAYYKELQKLLGFELSDREINWSTLVLSTAPSQEDILKGFADNHRQSVKKAIKMGLTTEIVTDVATVDTFAIQHSDMYASRGLATDKEKNIKHYRKLFEFFQKHDAGYLIVVKEADKIIGGVCCAIQGNAMRYMEGYSLPDYRKYPVNHIALYEAIKITKQKGIAYFDFGGYANNVKEGDQLYAINKFKEAFRGDLVNYPKTMLIFTLPGAKWLYSLRKG